MARNSQGSMSGKTRKLRGKTNYTISDMLKSFKVGDKVVINPKAYYKALPPLRFKNKVGIVEEIRGKAYVVKIKDGNMDKRIITYSVHLKSA